MAVFKPMNRNSSSVTNRNTADETNTDSMENTNSMNHCQCYEHEQEQNVSETCGCGCPCPKPIEPVITISVDEGPAILEPDIIYGPPGKDGTINGYNKVKIEGSKLIKVEESERMIDDVPQGVITIKSKTSEHDIDAIIQEECGCSCDECVIHRQDRYSACWTIVHELHKKPSVVVVDTNDRVVECEVQYIGYDKVKLYFNQEFKGKAYLN